jgi:glyceraldehyde 3-phosphate dehydrogenase
VVAVNGVRSGRDNSAARFDSVHGRFPREVKVERFDQHRHRKFKVTAIRPVAAHGKNSASTSRSNAGIFTARTGRRRMSDCRRQARHRLAFPLGRRRLTVVYGINHKLTRDRVVISNALRHQRLGARIRAHDAVGIERA